MEKGSALARANRLDLLVNVGFDSQGLAGTVARAHCGPLVVQWEVQVWQLAGELSEPIGLVSNRLLPVDDTCNIFLITHRLGQLCLKPETTCGIACGEIREEHR